MHGLEQKHKQDICYGLLLHITIFAHMHFEAERTEIMLALTAYYKKHIKTMNTTY